MFFLLFSPFSNFLLSASCCSGLGGADNTGVGGALTPQLESKVKKIRTDGKPEKED